MRGDTELLVACLEMQQKFKDVLDPKEAQYRELQAQSEQLHLELSQVRSQLRELEKDIAMLEWERPDWYIYWKGRCIDFMRFVLEKVLQLFEMVKGVFWRWWERRKTHPLY